MIPLWINTLVTIGSILLGAAIREAQVHATAPPASHVRTVSQVAADAPEPAAPAPREPQPAGVAVEPEPAEHD